MTRNQIDYWNYKVNEAAQKETARSNVVKEGETERHNRATEDIDLSKLNETARHNVAQEGIDLSKLAETSRSNRANENLKYYDLSATHAENQSKIQETQRSNLANEDIAWKNWAESVRTHKATESNVATANDLKAELNRITEEYNSGRLDLSQAELEVKQMLAEVDSLYKAGVLNNQNAANMVNMINALSRSSSAFSRIFGGLETSGQISNYDWFWQEGGQ